MIYNMHYFSLYKFIFMYFAPFMFCYAILIILKLAWMLFCHFKNVMYLKNGHNSFRLLVDHTITITMYY